jgi:N-sulfoglucosamine sulfohydrolase
MKNQLCASLLVAASLPFSAGASDQRPNIVLITTDDQGLDLGCYGNRLARTPHLDQLAAEGTRFTRAYVTQASCSPSRSSILTGLYPHQNRHFGLTNNFSMQSGIQTLPEILKNAGYRTGIIGKLHVNPKEAFPFDFNEMGALATRYVRRVNTSAQNFMDAGSGEPFFLMVNYFDPHDPYDDLANQCDGLPEKPYGPEDIAPFDFLGVDVPELRKQIAIYYNCVSRADTGVGMLLDSLKARGLDDNTLVIFLSDNGPAFTRGKATNYEAGLHVPFIVYYPRGTPGQVRDELVSAVDIVPTILEAVGVQTPDHLPGKSLLPLLRGSRPPWREYLFAEFTAHGIDHYYPRRSVRDQRFKLIHNLLAGRQNPWTGIDIVRALGEQEPLRNAAGLYNAASPAFFADPARSFGAEPEVIRRSFLTYLNPPEFELYDLENDPYERTDLSGNPEYADILAQLRTQLETCRQETKDPFLSREYTQEFTRRADLMKKNKESRAPMDLPDEN